LIFPITNPPSMRTLNRDMAFEIENAMREGKQEKGREPITTLILKGTFMFIDEEEAIMASACRARLAFAWRRLADTP